jgi:NADPH2 dehydrogenase
LARYFKFHSLDELDAGGRELGLDLRFSNDLEVLFRPVQVGSLRAGNSLCIHPMEGCDGTLDGSPGELTYRRFARFGGGGAKLLWGEANAVAPEGRATCRQLHLNEANAAEFEELVRTCRQAHRQACGNDDDLVLGLQLTHSGRYSWQRPAIAYHDPLLDPRTVADKTSGRKVDASYPTLTDDELARLVDRYVASARLAYKCGFQFVDIKQCHRYLLNELLAAQTRPGKYGGSLENRTRLARDIITAVRSEVPGLVVASRINAFDGIPFNKRAADAVGEPCPLNGAVVSAWGTSAADPQQADLAEPIAWIGEMARLGVAMVNISMGNPYASPHFIRPFEYPPPDGYETPEHPLVGVDRHFRLTAAIQQAYPDLPIVGSGYSYLQEYMMHAGAANLRDRRVTFVGIGRGALPLPDFARQIKETGRLDRKHVCRTFSYCTALMRSKHNELGQFATGCPPFDKEVYAPIWEEARGKK